MTAHRSNAHGIAMAFLSGAWTKQGLTERGCLVLGAPATQDAIDKLAALVLEEFSKPPPPPTVRVLADFIERQPIFEFDIDLDILGCVRQLDLSQLPQPVMTPSTKIRSVGDIPSIVTAGQLADWLELPRRQLEWFADCHGLECHRPREALRHYRYRWIGKRRGGQRLLEVPKPRLKQLQRQILHGIVDRIHPHATAHAFRPGRSIATFAAPHAGQRVVLRIDLCDFFPSVARNRVFSLFHTIGYPESIARLLCGLCTNTVPREIIELSPDEMSVAQQQRLLWHFGKPHLPQGAPTSPALANLAAYRLDCRLSALAAKCHAVYTRYADDLVFSGGRQFERRLRRFRVLLLAIVLDEGFAIQHRKTQVMRRSGRQQVAGILVNERPNISRREFDHLKAILFNCVRNGPHAEIGAISGGQTQDAANTSSLRQHLEGKIAFSRMVNGAKADRLQRLFDQIDWDES